MMIELNLLPKELRKRKKKKKVAQMPTIPYVPISTGILTVVVCVYLTLLLLSNNSKGLEETLSEKWDEMQPQRNKTEQLAKDTLEMKKRVIAVRGLAKPEKSWAEVLSGLNQSVAPNVWLTDFELKPASSTKSSRKKDEEPGSVKITGFALGQSGEATVLVAKFITSLKDNKSFSEGFKEIELANLRNTIVEGDEAMLFKLDCTPDVEELPEVKKTPKKRRGR